MKDIKDILPILDIERGIIVSKRGDLTVGFKLELPEIFTLSAEDYENIHHAWIRAIKVLPVGCILHKQDWFVESSYRANFDAEQSFLARASERFFHERAYLDHHAYLYLTMQARPAGRGNSGASLLLKKSIVPSALLDQSAEKVLVSAAGQFVKLLNDSGFISVNALDDAALRSAITYYMNLDMHTKAIRDICFDEHIRIGEKHCRVFSLADPKDLPAVCGPRISQDKYSTDKTKFSIAFATPVGQLLNCNHIYNQYVVIEDATALRKKFEARKLRLQSLSAYSRENGISAAYTDQYLNESIAEQRQPVSAHFNILAWSDDVGEMSRMQEQCSSALSQMDATPKIETVGAPQIFWAGIPGNAADLPNNECFFTFSPQAACFFNTETNYRSSSSPMGMRLGDRISGRPIHVDLSDEPMKRGIITNRNKFILGPSGSGKSFYTNHMLRSYYDNGAHIVLVDVGHSYRGLCDLAGGYYFTYSEGRPIQFNPFFLRAGENADTERKESIKTLLLALWKKDDETFKRSEYVALSNALEQYYQSDRGFQCFNSFYEFLKDEFVQSLIKDEVKDKDFDVSNFLYVLRPYYKGGEFDYLLNASTDLDLLDQRFIVFELDNIKDHPILLPVVTIIIMETFISKMRKLKGVRKIILIEEAWKAIAREGMAEYIKYLFKTVRKFYGEAIVVTQDVEDIISSPVIKQAIINNADCKILFDQSKYVNKFEQVQQLLGLSEKEKTLLLSLNRANEPGRIYKEVFISLGGTVSRVYRTEVSREEYLTYTTEESEKMKVQKAAAVRGSTELGIRSLVNDAI
jgi:conjugation system TraG family ATPase